MFFQSTTEFLLVIAFLLVHYFIRKLNSQLPAKLWVFVANIVLLNTVVNYETLIFQLGLSSLVYLVAKGIHKSTSKNIRVVVTALTVMGLVAFFVIRNYLWDGAGIVFRLGMSYILFRHIQFLTDVHKNEVKHFSWLDFVNFVLFFPNFLAGPIDKYQNFKRWSDKESGVFLKSLVYPGIARIAIGIIKKYALVPFIIGYAVDYNVLMEQEGYGLYAALLLSLLYYSAYIYLDFSGYSDIAIGTGYLTGIRTPENFRSPYLSTNISAFWRRWHITFSDFLRDLIFKPIVKTLSKKVPFAPRLLVSSIGYILTFVICGLWHGNTLNFIYWGLWHGIGLVGYKIWDKNVNDRLRNKGIVYNLLMMTTTFVYVTIGWMFFNYSHEQLVEIFNAL